MLDFSTGDFDAFTMHSVGVPVCQKYELSKGKSLSAFLDEASDIDKISAINELLKYLNIDLDHTIAFGDNDVDIEMLKESYIGIAMGNGRDSFNEI